MLGQSFREINVTFDRNTLISIILAFLLLVVSVVSYSLNLKKTTSTAKLLFECEPGRVIFPHKYHYSEHGLKLTCEKCHHHAEDPENIRACDVCHTAKIGNKMPGICRDCHSPDENHHPAGADLGYACNACHTLPVGNNRYNICMDCHELRDIKGKEKPMLLQTLPLAIHKQCIDCHKAQGSGPVDCTSCHIR